MMAKEKNVWEKMIEGIDTDNKEQALVELKRAYDFLNESDNKDLAKQFKQAITKLEKEG